MLNQAVIGDQRDVMTVHDTGHTYRVNWRITLLQDMFIDKAKSLLNMACLEKL